MHDDDIDSVCLEPCLWVGDFLDWCHPLRFDLVDKKYTLYTWVPKGAKFVYMIKIVGHTLIYVPDQDVIFFAHPSYCISNQCPVNSMFLCQLFRDDNVEFPRLSFVDIMYYNNQKVQKCTTDRYNLLMQCQQYLSAETMFIQWCGEFNAMTPTFLNSLPHQTSNFLALSDDVGEVNLISRA